MNKPIISQVLESFMHCTLHRLTSGEPECRTGWNYPATRDWPCAGLNWAPRWRHCMILKVLLQAQAQAIPFSLGETAVGDEEGMSDPEEGRYCSCLRKRMSSARTSRAPSRAVFVFLFMFSVSNSDLSLSNSSPEGNDTFNFTMPYQGPKGVVESDEIVRIASTSTFQTSPSSSSKDEDVLSSCPTKSKWWVFAFLMFYWTRTPGSLLSQKGRATTTKEKVSQNKGP